MIIIINGALGVGKTETSWELIARFDQAVMLDGDYIGAVHPFEIYDLERTQYLYQTMGHLIQWHQNHGHHNFVINYVFEQPTELSALLNILETLDDCVRVFWLTSGAAEHEQRIRKRGEVQGELDRARELRQIMKQAASSGWIGDEVNTSSMSASDVANEIYRRI